MIFGIPWFVFNKQITCILSPLLAIDMSQIKVVHITESNSMSKLPNGDSDTL